MGFNLSANRLLFLLTFAVLFTACTDRQGIQDRYLAERLYYRASKLYQNIQVTPHIAGPDMYHQARESFREITNRYPLKLVRDDSSYSEQVRSELILLSGNSRMRVADLFYQQGQIDSALAQYGEIAAKYSGNRILSARALYIIASGYRAQGNWDDAVAAYETLLRDYQPFHETPQQPDVNMLQVPVFIAQGYQAMGEMQQSDQRYREARDYLGEILERWPETATARLAQEQIAATYINQERWQEAIVALQPLEAVYGESTDPSEITFTIATLYWDKLQQLGEAMKIYSQIVQAYPASPKLGRAYLGIGKIHLQLGELEAARQNLSKVIDDYASDVAAGANAQFSIALAYELEGEWNQALNEFRWIVDNYPRTPEALQVPSHILDHYLQFSEEELAAVAYRQALKDYGDLIATNEKSSLAAYGQWYIAQTHMKMERWADAIAALEAQAREYPQSPQAPFSLLKIGEIYEIHLKQIAPALGAYQKLIELTPGHPASQVAAQRAENLTESKE